MTDVSEQLYPDVCKYCGNCTADKKCLADVPYYCASRFCDYFTEENAEFQQGKIKPVSVKRLIKKTLVETF